MNADALSRSVRDYARALPFAKAYAGVGARRTPSGVLALMRRVGAHLGRAGWALWPGGAAGADEAFEQGAEEAGAARKVFLPFRTFRGRRPDGKHVLYPASGGAQHATAERVAAAVWNLHARREQLAPWERLKPGTRAFMARNTYQVLGATLSARARFLLCWTPDGCASWEERTTASGGTGQAIALASLAGLKVLNVQRGGHRARLEAMLEG